jgi:hypothetical protein
MKLNEIKKIEVIKKESLIIVKGGARDTRNTSGTIIIKP